MSIFDKIKNAIFGRQAEAAESAPAPASDPAPTPSSGTTPASAPASPTIAPSGASPEPKAEHPTVGVAPGAPVGTSTPSSASSAPVDVAAILEKAVKDSGQKLDWRRSVVDLMKALDLDSSLSERKELAHELGYAGNTEDSATMNVWLHKALMKKLAENGGKVPAELTD